MEAHFGGGDFFAIPLGASNATPLHLSQLQSFDMDFKFEEKKLMGQSQFPLVVARGKGSIEIKLKNAILNGSMLNNLFFGNTQSAGQLMTVVNEAGVVASNAYTALNGATFATDLGVTYAATGVPLTKVASAPATGQYSVNSSTGVYTFAAGDTGTSSGVVVNYTYNLAATGNTATIINQAMGSNVQFKGIYTTALPIQGVIKRMTLQFNVMTTSDLKMSAKQDDFMMPEMSASVMADSAGNVGVLSLAD